MPSRDEASQNNHGPHRPAMMAILLVQIVVLLALSGAAIVYLDWSSNAAQAEFMRAIESASGPSHGPQSSTPVQHVKERTSCPRRV